MADTPAEFEREHGCTEAEWLRSLPGAVGAHHLSLPATGRAVVALQSGGGLTLEWSVLPERQVALISLPRMQVRYAFSGEVASEVWASFMRLFDLHMHRGGG